MIPADPLRNLGPATILRADARDLPLADNSVDLIVTSPPYFALRSYLVRRASVDRGLGVARRRDGDSRPQRCDDGPLGRRRDFAPCALRLPRRLRTGPDMRLLIIDVHGLPAPQGSKRAITHRSTGRPIVIESGHAKVQTWREDVKQAALKALRDHDHIKPFTGPVTVAVGFYLPRPKSHYRTGRNAHLLRDQAPLRPVGKPDLDKLIRSTLDALTTAGVWPDDKFVVDVDAGKWYADPADPVSHVGAVININEAS